MMSVFVYLDQNQTPTGVQHFETMPGVDIVVPSGVLYVENASVLPSDLEIISHWRVKSGILADVGPNPGPSYRWDVASESWIPDLEKSKVYKLQELKTTRDQKEFGGFIWSNSIFDSDPISQVRIQGGVSLAQQAINLEQPFSIDWTLKDNTTRSISATEMIQVGLALANHVAAIHEIYKNLKNQINTATTIQNVDSITWP
jgi:hypothetical protein